LQVAAETADVGQPAQSVDGHRVLLAVELAPAVDELLEELLRLLQLALVVVPHRRCVQPEQHLVLPLGVGLVLILLLLWRLDKRKGGPAVQETACTAGHGKRGDASRERISQPQHVHGGWKLEIYKVLRSVVFLRGMHTT